MKKQRVDHGMLLDGKKVMDNALPELQELRELIAEKLHDEFDAVIAKFQTELAACDVSSHYKEIGKPQK